MKQFYGNYRGFVLTNVDPEKAGRVKVWVPAVHGRNFNLYNENSTNKIGGLSEAEVNDQIAKLPWADVAQPMVGGGGSSANFNGSNFVVGDGTPFTGSTIPVKSNGTVDPEQLRGYLINQIKGSSLNGFTPKDGDRFKIDGSAESWANYFVTLAERESSFNVNTKGDTNRPNDIPEGSHGLFQLSPVDALTYGIQEGRFTFGELTDPAINTKIAISIHETLLRDGISTSNGNTGSNGYIVGSKLSNNTFTGPARYWGPLQRGIVNPPDVPAFIPTSPTNQPPVSPDENITDTPTPVITQKPAQAFAPSSNRFNVTTSTRDQLGGSSAVRNQGRPISLDFNSGSPSSGILIIVPDDITQEERTLCEQYVQGCSNFFEKYSTDPKSKKISSNPIRTTTENSNGLRGFFHTEPWNDDGAAMQAVIDNPQEFANILASTLGNITNALFLPPHKQGGAGGAVFKPNNSSQSINERDFALQNILPFLGGANGGLTIDAFSSVGNKHPEETRDDQFLQGLNIDSSEVTQNGKEIYNLIQKSKGEPTGKYDQQITDLKTQRDTIWNSIIEKSEDEVKADINQYLSRYSNNRDYTSVPSNSKVNPASQSYGSNTYNNVSKGSFLIPDIGAKVWMFFAEGEIENPVVFANNPDAQDYAGIFDISSNSPDYPVEKEGDEVNIERSKYVLNHRGGTLEIVGTTGNESMKIASYQGNTYEMNKLGVSELVIGNKSQLVRGDKFTTVKGDELTVINNDKEVIVTGDVIEKYGNVRENVEIAQQIKELQQPIHDKFRLFDLKRTEASHTLDSSPLQTKEGTNSPCPTCSGEGKFLTRTSTPITYTDSSANGGGKSEQIRSGTVGDELRNEDPENCLNCNGTGQTLWSAEGDFEKEGIKDEIIDDINNTFDERTALENQLGSGGNKTTYIAKSHVVHIGSVMNDLGSIRVDPMGKRALVGQIPSESGKVVAPMYVPVPHVEHVATNDLTGGDYFMSVANKYDLQVGANGVRIKSLGEVNIQGRIMTLAADQVIISSNNQVKFDGGQNLELKANSVTISPRTTNVGDKEFKSIALDGTVSVSNNMVVKGGAHVEGELSMQHLTAPLEIGRTETSLSYGNLIGGKTIGITSDGKTVTSYDVNSATASSHSHPVGLPPMTLVPTNDDVRRNAHCMSLAPPVLAQPINNTKARLKDYSCIRYFDPDLFALFEDCNDDDFNRLIDDIENGRDIEDVRAEFTRSSEFNNISDVKCEIDRTDLDLPTNN